MLEQKMNIRHSFSLVTTKMSPCYFLIPVVSVLTLRNSNTKEFP